MDHPPSIAARPSWFAKLLLVSTLAFAGWIALVAMSDADGEHSCGGG